MKITDITTISSKDNPRLKLARQVRDGRDKEGIFVEGARLSSELLKSHVKAEAIFVSDDTAAKIDELAGELQRSTGAEVNRVVSKVFDSITDTDNSQGIIVLAQRPETAPIAGLNVPQGLLVFLSRINNPSNLGAVVRTAEASGAAGILISPASADPFSPKALRASMGSAFRLPIYCDVPLEEAAQFARENGIKMIAADVKAARSYTEVDWRPPIMLVFGSEAHGLDDLELSLVDEKVFIPMENDVESLNLAVSAGILLFEAKRQRQIGNDPIARAPANL